MQQRTNGGALKSDVTNKKKNLSPLLYLSTGVAWYHYLLLVKMQKWLSNVENRD